MNLAHVKNVDILIKKASKEKIEDTLLEYFKKNINTKDTKIHSLAEEFGVDPDDLEDHIYKLLSSFLGQGKSKDFKGEYDPTELEMGIKVEMEHTTNKKLAERIAKDHLSEIPDYYTRLKKMEKEAGIKD